MPVTLGEEIHHTFSTENEPFTDEMIETFILPLDNSEADEFTEFVPCFRIADTIGFEAIVYWKAALLVYEYHLVTYNAKGQMISHKVIAKTTVKDKMVERAIATIDDELVIFIAEGASADNFFDPTQSKTYNMEILSNGEIIIYNVALN